MFPYWYATLTLLSSAMNYAVNMIRSGWRNFKSKTTTQGSVKGARIVAAAARSEAGHQ